VSETRVEGNKFPALSLMIAIAKNLLIAYVTILYWIGVFTGRLSHAHYTNGNMDSFIHGALGFVGPWVAGLYFARWYMSRKKLARAAPSQPTGEENLV
jgi:uncharacterized membrane protein YeaQ/YmgE (transglycosylase-associated protein family)